MSGSGNSKFWAAIIGLVVTVVVGILAYFASILFNPAHNGASSLLQTTNVSQRSS